jgi:hypothetical protein
MAAQAPQPSQDRRLILTAVAEVGCLGNSFIVFLFKFVEHLFCEDIARNGSTVEDK